MEHAHPAPTPVPRDSPDAAKKKEACIALFGNTFATGRFSNSQLLTEADRRLKKRLLANLQPGSGSSNLDLSGDDRDLVEFANPEMLQAFAVACKQIDHAVTSLKLPLGMLSVPEAWITHLPELREMSFGPGYMGRAIQLHSLSKLKKVNIGRPVNLKLLSMPAGCVAQADADFQITLDKNFQAKNVSDPLIERGFLTVVERDPHGVLHGARKYRLSEPYWPRGTDTPDIRWQNLNAAAIGPGLERPLACAELAALWLNNRYAYRMAKQALIAAGTNNAKSNTNAKPEPVMRFDYGDFATITSLLNANQQLSLVEEYSSVIYGAPRQHVVRISEWPSFVREQFKSLTKGLPGAFRLFALETVNHAMALEFLVQNGPDGKPLFILTFYEPNITKLHKRYLARDLSEVAAWRLDQLDDDLKPDHEFQPLSVPDPSVFLAEFRTTADRRTIRGEFPDKTLTRKIVKLWPTETASAAIDPACHLMLLQHLHFDMWRELVGEALASLSEQDRIRFLSVPAKDEGGRVVSQLAETIEIETWEQVLRLLQAAGKGAEKDIDTLISILGAGTYHQDAIQTSERFQVLAFAIQVLGSTHSSKPLNSAQIVKLLSARPSHEDGIGTLLGAMVFFDIGMWLEQLMGLKNSKLIGNGEIRQIMESHAPAHKGGWQAVVQHQLAQRQYRCVRHFYMALADLGLRLDAAGQIVETPAGHHSAGAVEFRERLSKELPDPHAALLALALALCDGPPPDVKDALFHAMSSSIAHAGEMFEALWAFSHSAKDKWEFVAAELCSIKTTSAAVPRYLFNELHDATQFAVGPDAENVADTALDTLIGIQRNLSQLVKDGMSEKVLIRICGSLIDPATPDDTDLNEEVLEHLNLHWKHGALASLSTTAKAHV